MFDTINGLPVHALVVHATVVLLPLMAVVTVLVAFRPALRERFAWWVVAVDAALVVLVLVTKQSGQKLQARLGGQIALQHGRLGSALVWFALGLLAAAVVMALTGSRPGRVRIASGAFTVLAAIALVVWTVRVGDSGARALWGGLPGR